MADQLLDFAMKLREISARKDDSGEFILSADEQLTLNRIAYYFDRMKLQTARDLQNEIVNKRGSL